jgi:hypothetical protein
LLDVRGPYLALFFFWAVRQVTVGPGL